MHSFAKRKSPQMTIVSCQLVKMMRERLKAQTDEALQDQLGISWTTWMKVRSGQPILLSTHDRLVRRLQLSCRS